MDNQKSVVLFETLSILTLLMLQIMHWERSI